MSRRVLVIDDDEIWRETYRDELEAEGYEVTLAADAETGLAAARTTPAHHVIVLDQRLEGPGGGDTGLDLVTPLVDANPAGRVLVVTGFENADALQHAFGRGAFDYLVKRSRILMPMLKQKVRQAADAAEAAMADRSEDEREAELLDTWAEARREAERSRKGALLERTLQLLLQSLPGLHEARRDRRPVGEQLDLVVRNDSDDPFIAKQGALILVECKNWTARSGVPEVAPLLKKMKSKHGRCQLGLFVSMNGFATTVRDDLLSERQGAYLVVLLDGDRLDAWIRSPDRLAWLKTAIEDASLR